jgi:uncharacterized protein YecT (DUF1311 family)
MRSVPIFLFVLIPFAVQDSALAGEPSTLAGASSCDTKSSNYELTQCLNAVAKKLDLLLARYVEAKRTDIRKYAADVGKNEPERAGLFARELEDAVRSLERAQTSWVAYRDAHCDMIARLYLDGTGKGAAEVKCSIDLTVMRIRELWTGPHSGLPDPN